VLDLISTLASESFQAEQNMALSRSGSVSITAHSGTALAIHTRTHDEEDLPHATKRFVALVDPGTLERANVVANDDLQNDGRSS
jgi:hypothetical protein